MSRDMSEPTLHETPGADGAPGEDAERPTPSAANGGDAAAGWPGRPGPPRRRGAR